MRQKKLPVMIASALRKYKQKQPRISLILHGLKQRLSQRLWFEGEDHGMHAK
jgi:hypothetical protein